MCTWIDAEWEGDVRRYPWYVSRRGPHVYAQRQRSLGGHYRVLGLYDTPEEAVQARDTAIIRLGSQDIAHLNNP